MDQLTTASQTTYQSGIEIVHVSCWRMAHFILHATQTCNMGSNPDCLGAENSTAIKYSVSQAKKANV